MPATFATSVLGSLCLSSPRYLLLAFWFDFTLLTLRGNTCNALSMYRVSLICSSHVVTVIQMLFNGAIPLTSFPAYTEIRQGRISLSNKEKLTFSHMPGTCSWLEFYSYVRLPELLSFCFLWVNDINSSFFQQGIQVRRAFGERYWICSLKCSFFLQM